MFRSPNALRLSQLSQIRKQRRRRVESLEPRQMLATDVILGSVDQFTGPADLNLDPARVEYAINFSQDAADLEVSGVTFQHDRQAIPGAQLVGPREVSPWQTKPEFGSTTDDNNLEQVMQDIRWALQPGEQLQANLDVTPGREYRLQLLISANVSENRVWDITVEGDLAVDEITSLGISGTTYDPGRSTVYTYEFVAPDNVFNVAMGGPNFPGSMDDGGDGNAIWQGLVLTDITSTDFTWDGDSDGDGDGSSWNDADNWSGGVVPGPTDRARFANDDVGVVDLGGGTVQISGIDFENTAGTYDLTNGTLEIDAVVQSGDADNVVSSVIDASSRSFVLNVGSGSLRVANTGNLLGSDDVLFGLGGEIIGSDGASSSLGAAEIILDGGTLTFDAESTTPLELGGVNSNLQLWLDSADVDGNNLPDSFTDGQLITGWTDKSGLGHNADGVLGTPFYVASSAAAGNMPVIGFSTAGGADQLYTSYNFDNLPDDYTVIAASRYTGGSTERVVTSKTRNWLFGHWRNSDSRWYADGWIHQAGDANTNLHIYSGLIGPTVNGNAADPGADFWKDGVLLTNDNTGSNNTTYKPGAIALGAWTTGGEASNAEVAEVIIYDRLLSSSERASVENYLAFKYGVVPANDVTLLSDSTINLTPAAANSSIGSLNIAGGATLSVNGSGQELEVTGATTLAGNATIAANTANVQISGGVNLGNWDLSIGGAGNTLITGGTVAGSGGLVKNDSGTLTIESSNSYSGATTINGGVLVARHGNALGADSGDTIINGAELRLEGDISIPAGESLTMGSTLSSSGDNTWNGDIALTEDSEIVSDGGTLTINGDIDMMLSDLTVEGTGDVIANGDVSSSPAVLVNLDDVATGDQTITADSQTFDARVDNQNGTGWLLIGRGREGWEFDADGQGAVADVNQGVGTPSAFTPAAYSSAILNDVLSDAGSDLTGVEIRIRRAEDPAGTSYQESRWQIQGETNWVWNFDRTSPTTGYPVRYEIIQGQFAGLVQNTNTRDNIVNNSYERIFTWAWGSHNNQKGFSFGSAVNNGSNDPNSYLWEFANEQHAIPYTEVYIRLLDPPTNDLIKNGTGTLTLAGNNSYTGETYVNAGTVVAAGSDTALGTTATGTTVASGATLAVNGNVTIEEAVWINGEGSAGQVGALASTGGDNIVNGTVTATGISAAIGAATGTLTIAGSLDMRASDLTIDGAGDTTIAQPLGGLGTNAGATYEADALALGAAGYYSFDDVSGTTVTNAGSTGATNDGAIQGTAAVAGGLLGQGLQIGSGTANRLLLNNNGVDIGPGGWTASFWFNGINAVGAWRTGLRGASTDHQLIVQNSSTQLGVYDNGNGQFRPSGYNVDPLIDGEWHHIVARGNAGGPATADSTTDFFVDGVYVGTSDRRSISELTAIGNCTCNGQPFGNLIDEVALYQRPLSNAEIQQLSALTVTNNLTKNGDGTLTLSAANTYNGETAINEGVVIATDNNSLGTTDAGTNVASGATLALNGNVTIDESLWIDGAGNAGQLGALASTGGDNSINGSVTATGTSTTIGATTGSLTIAGAFNMFASDLTVDGSGDTTIAQTLGGLGSANAGATYEADALALGAAGYYSFDNVSGSNVVNSGSTGATNDGAIQGTAAVAGGLVGQGLQIGNGSANRLLLNNNGIDIGPGGWTASFWFNGINGTASWRTGLRGASTDHQLIVENGSTRLGVYDNGNGQFRPSGYDDVTPLIDGEWHHIVARGNAGGPATADSTTDFFVDGVYVGTSDRRSISELTAIGNCTCNGQPFGNLLDEVALFQRPLTDAEIQQLSALTVTNNLVKNGSGTLTLSAANTYNGETNIHEGVVIAADDSSLGTADSGTTVAEGASLALSGGITIAGESLALAGAAALVNLDGDNVIEATASIAAATPFPNPIGITSNVGSLTIDADIDLRLSKLVVDGSGNVVVNGDIGSSQAALIDPQYSDYILNNPNASVTDLDAIAYWPLNETAPTTAIDVIGSRDGSYDNFVAGDLNQPGAVSGNDASAQFDGANNQVTVPHDAGLNTLFDSNYTVAFWMYKDSEAGDWQRLIGKGQGNIRTVGVWEEAGAGKRILFQVYANGGARNLFSTTTVEIGQWYHIVATMENDVMRLFINGNEENGTQTLPGPVLTTSDPLTFGKGTNLHTFFPGRLDEITLHDRALNGTEISDLYDSRDNQGVFMADNQLMKMGSGTLILAGDNTYDAGTTVTDGTLLVANSSGSATGSGDVSVSGTGIFAGSGSVTGNVTTTAGGIITPGAAAGDPASLATGSLAVDSTGIGVGDITSSGNDTLVVTGSVDVTNGNFALFLEDDFDPAAGQVFVLIDNDGADPIIGEVSDGGGGTLSEGESFELTHLVGGVPTNRRFEISYVGGDGNDLVITTNRPPVAVDVTVGTDEDMLFDSAPVSVLDGASDADNDPMTVTAINGDAGAIGGAFTLPSGASLTMTSTGEFTYDPVPDFSGTDSFTYTVSDGELTDTATVTVNIAPVADTPTLTVTTATGDEDTTIDLSITANTNDADGSETLDVTIANIPVGATLDWNDGAAQSFTATAGNTTIVLTDTAQAVLDTFTVTPPLHSDIDMSLAITATANDSATLTTGAATDSTSVSATLNVEIAPVADLVTLTVSDIGGPDNENTAIPLPITTALIDSDGSEVISSVTISGLPAEAVLSAGINNGGGNWTLTEAQLAGLTVTQDNGPNPSDSFTVTVVVETTDTDTESLATDSTQQTSDTLTYTIDNTPPVATITGPTSAVPGFPVDFNFAAIDPSVADSGATFDYLIDWGDGNSTPITGAAASGTVPHEYGSLGTFTIEITATDIDNETSAVGMFTIDLVPVALLGDDIYAGGTDGVSDRIIFFPSNGGVRVRYNNEFYPTDGTSFPLTTDTRLIAFGRGSSDRLIVSGRIAAPAEFDGGEGNDYLATTDEDDILIGGPGNDVMLAGEGDNLLIGDDRDGSGPQGNDRLEGRSGVDTLFGGGGNDRLNGGAGDDILDGGSDNDFIFGGLGNDLMFGGLGVDTLRGHYGHDIVLGGADADQLFGDSDHDLTIGGAGSDRVRGDGGDDVVAGGASDLDDDIAAALAAMLATEGQTLTGADSGVAAAVNQWFNNQNRIAFGAFDETDGVDDLDGGAGEDEFFGTSDLIRNFRVGEDSTP